MATRDEYDIVAVRMCEVVDGVLEIGLRGWPVAMAFDAPCFEHIASAYVDANEYGVGVNATGELFVEFHDLIDDVLPKCEFVFDQIGEVLPH